MIKPDYDAPDLAVVAEVADGDVRVVFQHHLDGELDDPYVSPADLSAVCNDAGIKQYTFEADAMALEPQY